MTNDTRRVRVVQAPRVDYLSVAGFTTAEECGFVERETASGAAAWWRPGWWGVQRAQKGRPLFTARADKGLSVWPQAWGYKLVHVTRVDVCCDITGFIFRDSHRDLFTTRSNTGRSQVVFAGHEAQTLYIGSRESPVLLRIYNKTDHCKDTDREVWSRNGWRGGEVWRVEYEFHRKALPRQLVLPQHATALWADGLARVRMCAAPPRGWSQQNKAPTHELWSALGHPQKLTRVRGELPGRDAEEVAAIERALERLMVRAGPLMLAGMEARLRRARKASGV